MKIKGSCYCQSIRFEIAGEIDDVVYCHCSQCRKLSGHYVAATRVDDEAILVEGAPKWFSSSPGIHRAFCPDCGTPLFWKDESQKRISIMAGALDTDVKITASHHIYVKDKAAYYPICDGLAQYAQSDRANSASKGDER